jgi:hypothetical protein
MSQEVRDALGYTRESRSDPGEYDYWSTPRARQLRERHRGVTGLDDMQRLMAYNSPDDPAIDGQLPLFGYRPATCTDRSRWC